MCSARTGVPNGPDAEGRKAAWVLPEPFDPAVMSRVAPDCTVAIGAALRGTVRPSRWFIGAAVVSDGSDRPRVCTRNHGLSRRHWQGASPASLPTPAQRIAPFWGQRMALIDPAVVRHGRQRKFRMGREDH